MGADYALLMAAVGLALLGLLAGDGIINALMKKGWLLKIAERLGMEIKEEEK